MNQGYAINERQLAEKEQQVPTLRQGIRILSRSIEDRASSGALDWLAVFTKSLALLGDCAHEQLDRPGRTSRLTMYPDLTEYRTVADAMKVDFDLAVFGKEKDRSFQRAIAQISTETRSFCILSFYLID